MEELEEAPSSSSKMDQHDRTPETVDEPEDVVNIKLPEQLQKITPAEEFISVRHRWNTNEEIASILIAFDRHKEWLVLPQKIRRDGYCWKKRRNGSTIREDHMKLKVQGLECIYGSYVHSAILPTFHRRCYWLLQNPNIVLIHYLNVPYPEAAKPSIPSLSYELRQKEWTKEELVDQLRPMLSQVTQGTELDVEEDQKVEKLLEEILPLLMPMQESNKSAHSLSRITRPLAPAPLTTHLTVTSTPSSSSVTSISTSLKRPVRKQLRSDDSPASCKPDSLQIMGNIPPSQGLPSLLPHHLVPTHQQFQSLQPQGTVSNAHSLNGNGFSQKNNQSPLIINTTSAQNFESVSQDIGQNLSSNLQKNSSDFLGHNVTNVVNGPRFLAIGTDVIMSNSLTPADRQNVNSAYTASQTHLLPTLSPIFSNQADSGSRSSLPPKPAQSLMTAVADHKEAPSSLSLNNFLQDQESQLTSGSQHHFHLPVQQQQQHMYQLVAQQNHSFTQDNIETQQVQLQPSQAPAPVLTLHLKPTNLSSSDSSGFVLSLKGATTVSQQNEQPGLSGFSTNKAPSLNLSNSQGVVLVASHSPSGGLVLNRVSPSIHPVTTCFTTSSHITCSPVVTSSSHQMFTQNSTAHVCSSDFVMSTSSLTSMANQPNLIDNSLSQTYTFSSPSLRKEGIPQVNPLIDVFSMANSEAFPLKTDNESFPVNNNGIQFSNHYSDSKENTPGQIASSFGLSRNDIAITNYNSTSHISNLTQPSFAQAFSNNNASESSTLFSVEKRSLQIHNPQTVCDDNHPTQQLEITDLMAGPLGINSSVKDMITNPNSCDTLDGSFSSLPSADLNLDDLLDLNDLDDVSDLGCSPFTPSDISEQAIDNNGMAVCDKSDIGNVMNLTVQGESAISDNLSPYTCLTNPMMCQQNGSGHKSTMSPLNSGVSLQLSFPTLMGCQPVAMDNQGSSSTHDPEINAVIKDFSPDWAYSKTSTKILVAGPWISENASYSCVFDGEHIPAFLLQPGLLRCYTQYHPPGFATLQVARNGIIISNLEVFEFCDKEQHDYASVHSEWFAIDSRQLKLLLIERLDYLRRHFTHSSSAFPDITVDDNETLETLLIQQVKALLDKPWTDSNLYLKAGQHNLTLLHLAAGLGYAKFIAWLIRWRLEKGCVALEFEIDAQSVDSHACTPMMWACALGKIDAALTLYHWNASPLKMCNKDGLLPLALARQKGHFNLASQVEQLEKAKEQKLLKEQQQNSNPVLGMDVTCLHDAVSSNHPSSTSSDFRSQMLDDRKDELELKDELTIPPTSFPKPGKPGPKLIRRYSEQVINQQSRTLSKRNSIDILPSGQDIDHVSVQTMGSPLGHPVRETISEPQLLPVSPDMAFVAPPAPRLLLEDEIDEPAGYSGETSAGYSGETSGIKMDTDEICARVHSPIIDVERISSDEEADSTKEGSKHQMVTLANQIIAAIPERIKLSPPKGDDVDDASSGRGRSESHSSLPSQGSPRPSSFGDDSGISTPMTDSLAFEEYRYPEFGTPASSLSPDSTCLPSPYSPYSFTLDSPPPTTAEFTEYFNAPTTYMEKDFSQLTLSDQEQRKLYEAAKVIQNAYRHYRDKQQQQQQQLQQQKEIEAAILIQSYYRRYKTYAYYKKMSHAAVLIQNQFRTYYAKRKKRGETGATPRRESERLKKGRNQSVIIQQRFRSHYQRRSLDGKEGVGQTPGPGEAPDRELYQLIQVVRLPSSPQRKLPR